MGCIRRVTSVEEENNRASGREGVAEMKDGLCVLRDRLDRTEGMELIGMKFCGEGGSFEFFPLVPHPLLFGSVDRVAVGETAYADKHTLDATDDSDVLGDGGVHGEGGVGDAQNAVVGRGMTAFDRNPSSVVVGMDVPLHERFATEQLVEMVHQETEVHVSGERHTRWRS